MLIKLTPNQEAIDCYKQRLVEFKKTLKPDDDLHSWEFVPVTDCEEEEGIYWTFRPKDYEFVNEIKKPFTYDEEYKLYFPERFDLYFLEGWKWKDQYGVADSIEQIKDYFKEEIEDPIKKYVISIILIKQNKGNRGKWGGWRWEKNGTYIGNHTPQCEYLEDEDFGPDFKHLIKFHIYPINH